MANNNETSFRRPDLRSHPKVRLRRFLANWPFLVWVAVVLLCFVLYTKSAQFGQLVGVVETVSEPIAPLQTARLKSIEVEVGDRVTNDQIVAQMETTLIDAQLASDKAEMLVAKRTLQSYQGDTHTLFRQFDTAIQAAEAALLAQKQLQEKDKAQLDELKKIQAERNKLFKVRLISENEVNQLKPEIAALEKTVAAYPGLIEAYKTQLEQTKTARAALHATVNANNDDDVAGVISKANQAQDEALETTIKMRELERDSYTLRATRGGIVSQIYFTPGDVVNSGSPVIKIVGESFDEIIGFLPEMHSSSLKKDNIAYAFREGRDTQAIKLIVESVAPEIDTMPGRISPIQGQTLRGRRVIFKIAGPHDLIPGETVQIRLMSAWWSKFAGLFARK